MSRHLAIAIIFIAAPALSTGSKAQNIFKCGATYSQVPCEGSVALNMADRRSKEQQLQSGKIVKQDARTAAAMEKARLKEEASAGANSLGAPKATRPPAATPEKKQNSVPTTTILSAGTGSKGSPSKNKDPEFFTATATTNKKNSKGESQR